MQKSHSYMRESLRKHPFLFSLLAIMVVVTTAGVVIMQPFFIKNRLDEAFARAGFPEATYQMTSCCYGEVLLKDVRLSSNYRFSRIRLEPRISTLWTQALTVELGKVVLSNYDLAAENLRVALGLEEGVLLVDIPAFWLKDQQKSPRFAPLRLEAKGEFRDKKLTMQLKAQDATEELALEATLLHDLEEVTGHVLLEEQSLHFSKGALQPDQLFPSLGGLLQSTEGTLDVSGKVQWSGAGVQPELRLQLRDVTGEVKGTRVHGVNGIIQITQFSPMETQGVQHFTVKLVEAGLPLQDGVVSFRLSDEKLLMGATQWQWGGGALTSKPFSIRLASIAEDVSKHQFILEARHVALQHVLAMMLKDTVEAEGRLTGRIPIQWKDGVPMLENATLIAPNDGKIRYLPKKNIPSQLQQDEKKDKLQIAYKAMENLHFSDLSLTLHNFDADTLLAEMRVNGRNPELFDGKAVELNVNLKVDYAGLLESGIHVFQVPKDLRKRLGLPQE